MPVCGAVILNSDLTKVLLVRGYFMLVILILAGKRMRLGAFQRVKSIKAKVKHLVEFVKYLKNVDLMFRPI